MGPRVLVFGSTGQLGRELARANWRRGVAVTALDRGDADLSRPRDLPGIVARHVPDAVIIAAAYTAVDKAEQEEELAGLVNGIAPGVIAEAAARLGAIVVYVSTDYVFGGRKNGFYNETDQTDPINAYGRTKLAGEQSVRAANLRHVILRTSWVYSAHGTNFLRTMLRLAASRDEVHVVDDQQGCPTAARDLATAIARLLPELLESDGSYGTYHLAGATATTWHGFAEAIFCNLAGHGQCRPRNLAIKSSAYPTAAGRPLNSRLSSDRFAQTFGFRLPGFEEACPAVVAEALAHG